MADLSDKTVAIIVADFIEDAELTTPRDSLRESGATVRIYSVSGETVQTVEGDTDPKQKIDVDGSRDRRPLELTTASRSRGVACSAAQVTG